MTSTTDPQPLIILHERYTPDCIDIWRAAIRRGWATERVNRFNVAMRLEGHHPIRYYGDLLHWDQIKDQMPIRMLDIDPSILPRLGAFTKRSIKLMRLAELVQPITARAFIKPVCVKWFEAKVYSPGDTINGAPELTDLIYVQDPVEYLDEVRCFCLDGKVLTSSLYRVNKVVYDLTGLPPEEISYDGRLADSPIPAMVTAIYATGLLPRAVVADFGTHADGSWSLIEFNEPWASGLYYCDPERCLDCIIETQSQNVG
jgi:hypothetical protein